MVATIEVERQAEDLFLVTVSEGGSRSTHRVTVSDAYHRRLTGGKTTPEDLLRRSFEFLLAREPKESILRAFDLPVIQRYFPEYEREIGAAIAR